LRRTLFIEVTAHMLDFIYIAVGLAFFAGSWLLVKACEKL
jgi:hypothetical protein